MPFGKRGRNFKNRSEDKSKAAQHPKGLALLLTERRLQWPLPRFTVEDKLKPFTFEELQKILELKADEIDTDLLIFNATISYLENLLGYQLADKNYNELQTVKDCQVFTDHEHISEMINIIDMTTKVRVPNCVIDGRRIIFIDPKLEGHVVFLNYNAGFNEDTLPADLKEVIVKLFLLKKKEFIKQINHEEEIGFELPTDIQNIIYIYRRTTL